MSFTSKKRNILITGPPGIGKTTLIKRLTYELQSLNPAGFYTEEIRVKGIRKGFALISLDGRKGVLSHTEIESPYSVGKYRVDVAAFDDFLDRISFFAADTGIIIIDEIGKMECLSAKFNRLLKNILGQEKPLIAAIARKGEGIIDEIKKRDDVELFVMTQANRNSLLQEILRRVPT